jgi:hypothetical protein
VKNYYRAVFPANKNRSSSEPSTLHPFPTFWARILPAKISLRKVGREILRKRQASLVLRTLVLVGWADELHRRSGLTRRSWIFRFSVGITFFLFFPIRPKRNQELEKAVCTSISDPIFLSVKECFFFSVYRIILNLYVFI